MSPDLPFILTLALRMAVTAAFVVRSGANAPSRNDGHDYFGSFAFNA